MNLRLFIEDLHFWDQTLHLAKILSVLRHFVKLWALFSLLFQRASHYTAALLFYYKFSVSMFVLADVVCALHILVPLEPLRPELLWIVCRMSFSFWQHRLLYFGILKVWWFVLLGDWIRICARPWEISGGCPSFVTCLMARLDRCLGEVRVITLNCLKRHSLRFFARSHCFKLP